YWKEKERKYKQIHIDLNAAENMHVTYREELNKWESKHEHKVRELTRQKDKLAMENMELMKAADKKDAELGALRRSHEHQISVYHGLLAKSQNGLTDDMFEKAAAAGGGGGLKRKDMMLGGAPEKGEEAKKSKVQKEAENPGRHRLGYYNSDEDDSDDSIEIQPRRDKPVVVAKQSGLSKHTASAIASARPFAAKKKSGVSGSKFNSLLGGSGKGAGNPLFAQRDRLKENSAPKGGKGGVIKQPRFEVAKPKGGGMKNFLKPGGKRTL
ncbi:hypothetical protein TeGR_g12912, partial [Tetraparma gracilis]